MLVIEVLENSDMNKAIYKEGKDTRTMNCLPSHKVHSKLSFPTLNPIQSVFHVKYVSGSALVATPTSSGKTVCAIDFMNKHEGLKVYTVPTKALAHEIYDKLKEIFGNVDIRTGDTIEDFLDITSDIVVCTYESFVLSLRNRSWGYRANAIVVDEIHHVFSSRGSVVEEAIALLKGKKDILGLSATLPRYEEIANWIEADTVVVGKWRPVPIVRREHSLKVPRNDELPEALMDKLFEISSEDETTILFVYKKTLGWEILKLAYERGYTIANDTLPFLKGHGDKDKYDFAYHNADIPVEEKQRIEKLFRNERIRFLIATQTLAYGVNLPADRVVILTTSFYDTERRKRVHLPSVIDIMQMEGRAGRFGIKDKGYVDILLYRTTKDALEEQKNRILVEGETEIANDLRNIKALFEDYLGAIARLSSFILSAYYTSGGNIVGFLRNTFSFRNFKDYRKLDVLISFLAEKGYIEDGKLTDKGMFCLRSGIPPTAFEEFLRRLVIDGNMFVKVRPLIFTKRMKGAYDVFLDDKGYNRLFSYASKLEPFEYPNDGSLEFLFYIHGEAFFLPNIHNPPSEMHLYTEAIHLSKHLYNLKERGYIVSDLQEIMLIAHAVRYGLEAKYAPLGALKYLGHIRTNALKLALKHMNFHVSFKTRAEEILENLEVGILEEVLSIRHTSKSTIRRETSFIINALQKQEKEPLVDEGILRRFALLIHPKQSETILKANIVELLEMFKLT